MAIQITWHLILVIVISIILIIGFLSGDDSPLDFSGFFYALILVIVWLVYGGIFIW